MKINEFAVLVSKKEGGKQNLTIAQISEVLKIVNGLLFGIPYILIRFKRHCVVGKGCTCSQPS